MLQYFHVSLKQGHFTLKPDYNIVITVLKIFQYIKQDYREVLKSHQRYSLDKKNLGENTSD